MILLEMLQLRSGRRKVFSLPDFKYDQGHGFFTQYYQCKPRATPLTLISLHARHSDTQSGDSAVLDSYPTHISVVFPVEH